MRERIDRETKMESAIFLQDTMVVLIRETLKEMVESDEGGIPKILSGNIEGIRDKMDRIQLVAEMGMYLTIPLDEEDE